MALNLKREKLQRTEDIRNRLLERINQICSEAEEELRELHEG